MKLNIWRRPAPARRRGIPQRDDDAAPNPRVRAAEAERRLIVRHDAARREDFRRHRAEGVADETAERDLAVTVIAIIVADRIADVGRGIADETQLPLVDVLDRREIDVDRIRLGLIAVAGVVAADAEGEVRTEAPAVGGVIGDAREIGERPEIAADPELADVGIDREERAGEFGHAPAAAEIPHFADEGRRIVERRVADAGGVIPDAQLRHRGDRLDMAAEEIPWRRPDQSRKVDLRIDPCRCPTGGSCNSRCRQNRDRRAEPRRPADSSSSRQG